MRVRVVDFSENGYNEKICGAYRLVDVAIGGALSYYGINDHVQIRACHRGRTQ
jgi:hypothetical protein